jgi:hypothetical protein
VNVFSSIFSLKRAGRRLVLLSLLLLSVGFDIRSARGDPGEDEKPSPPALPSHFEQRCTKRFCFRFAPSLSKPAARLARSSDRIVATVSDLLGGAVPPRTVVALSRTKAEFNELMPSAAKPPRWAAAIAFPRLAYIVMGPADLSESARHRATLLAHEYSHVALRHATGFRRLPTWFVEGFADLQARRAGPFSPDATQAPVPLSDLKRGFPADGRRASQAYAQSRDFVVFLYNSGTPADFRELISQLKKGERFRAAIEQVYGQKLTAIEGRWRRSFRFRKLIVPLVTSGVLLWILATVLLVLGYLRQKKRQRSRIERQPDGPAWPGIEETELESTEAEPEEMSPSRFPLVWVLAGLGLTFILTGLLRTLWPDVRLATLGALTGIGVLLALIIIYRAR